MSNERDEFWMRQALFEAEQGAYATWPNPWVGAVVVKNNQSVGRGFHVRAGMAHAEVIALRQAGKKAAGATLYVTLEPCKHQGKTPPCTKAILEAGIKRVVVACMDPNPVAKGGLAYLKSKGVETEKGVLEAEGNLLIRHFLYSVEEHRPWITMKAAMTLDGKIGTSDHESKWITSSAARRDARLLRGECDGILIGAGTLLRDNPRLLPEGRSEFIPWRFILDPKGQASGEERVFNDPYRSRTYWLVGQGVAQAKCDFINSKGSRVQRFEARSLEELFLLALRWMDGIPVRRLMVEGGSRVLGACLRQRLAQEIVLYISPSLLGGQDSLPAFGGPGPKRLKELMPIKDLKLGKIGDDFKISGNL